jgi:hypothetical protein
MVVVMAVATEIGAGISAGAEDLARALDRDRGLDRALESNSPDGRRALSGARARQPRSCRALLVARA